MKLIVNEREGCCESIHIEYTPVEALIINQAMRRYVNDEDVHEKDRSIMKQMLDVKPIFVDVAKSDEGKEKTGYMSREQAVNYLRSSGMSEEQRDEIIKALETRYDKLRRLIADLLRKGEIDERIHKIMTDEIDRLEEKDEP